jgi:two-component system cell cycle sensor histidine kinase/response regulator CckA
MAPSRRPTRERLEQEARALRARIAELEAAGSGRDPSEQPGPGDGASPARIQSGPPPKEPVEARRLSEQSLRSAFDTAATGMALVDGAGRWLWVNPALCELTGFSEAELLAMDFQSLTHPDDLAADLEGLRGLVAGEITIHRIEKRYVHKSGRTVWILLNVATLLTDVAGRATQFICQLTDITERVEAGRALLESEERFRNIVQASPMGMHLYTLEADGRLIFRGANHAAAAIGGFDHSELIGRTIEEAFPSLADTEVPQRYRLVCATGVPWQTEQIDYLDERIRGAFAVNAFRTAPNAMAVFFLDITRRKQDEEALRRERDFSDTLVQASPAYFVAITSDGKVRMMNQAMLSALGYSWEEAAGRDYLSTFVPQADRAALADVFTRLIRERGETVNENRTLTRDGRELFVEWHGRPVLRRDGELDYFFGVGIDITERRRAAAEQARLETELTQAQKMEAIGRLAGGVAHDFNNMLAAIQGHAELVLHSLRPDDPLHGQVEEILKAGQRAASLTQQLLAFSRRQVIAPQVIDLNELVADSTRMLVRLIGEDVVLDVLPAGDGSRVKADPHQLEQVLVNLAINARDAMPGGGTLTIGTAELEIDAARAVAMSLEPGRYVELSVSDTGDGMDEETKSRIFEPFFTTKEVGKGTGLGLATVHGIIRQNRGFIEVSSEPGRGATFRIYLPRVEAPVGETRQPARLSAAAGTETILLVEDEEIVRNLTRTILTRRGYHVLEAERGSDACLLCKSHLEPIHLLLTDVIMPKMNGRELYRQLRESRPDLRVLFMSGYTEDVIAPHGVLEDGTDFIEKPFGVDRLARKVREVLDR